MLRTWTVRLAALTVALVAGAAAGAVPPESKGKARVTGTLVFPEKLEFLAGTRVEVLIEDDSDRPVPGAEPLGKEVIRELPPSPIPFTVEYDPASVKADRRYVVFARVHTDRGVLYISRPKVPVITGDRPTRNVRVLMAPALPASSDTSP